MVRRGGAAMMCRGRHGAGITPHVWTLGLVFTAVSCGGDGPTVVGPPVRPPPGPPPPSATTIVMVSGDAQQGKAGEQLDQPLVVQVTDANGDGVVGHIVHWGVDSGSGLLSTVDGASPADTTPTDAAGRAQVFFQPTALGRGTVSASARTPEGPLAGSPVTFSTAVTTLVIEIAGGGWWCWDPKFFSGPGPDCTGDVTVPVGTTVEWVAVLGEGVWRATVTSTSVPVGGEAFDSGTLYRRQRFQFVPQVAGTWEYVDQFSGQTGTLTAR